MSSHVNDQTIEAAIANLYEAFANVAKPHMIDGCPCCIERKEVGVLLATPLRELSPDQLSPYAASAMLTVGSAEDLRYFLPRILEIRTADPRWWPDVEIIFRSLADADWHNWLEPEQDAVRQLIRTVLQGIVESDDAYAEEELDSWLCAIACAGESVVPYLEQMYADGRVVAIQQLHQSNAAAMRKGKLANSFWPATAKHEVIAWFERPDVKETINREYGRLYGAQF